MPIQREAFSDYLHRRRIALGRKWKSILSDAYLSRATLHRIRHGDPYQPLAEVDSLRSLANALKFNSWDDLLAAYESNDVQTGARSSGETAHPPEPAPTAEAGEDPVMTLSRALHLSPTELVRRLHVDPTTSARRGHLNGGFTLPTALLEAFRRPVKFVPHFSGGVAASTLVEKLEDENPENRIPIDTEYTRVFSVPVDGDCQHPVWKHGETVVFSFDAFEREGIVEGKSYYLAFTDGSTTFKRVFLDPADPEVYILRCWNHRRYPTQRRVHFSQVVRIARAIAKQTNPEFLDDDDSVREASS